MIDADWNRHRYLAIETQLMNKLLSKQQEPSPYPLAELFDPEDPAARALQRLMRHRETAERSWHRAYHELERIRVDAMSIQILNKATLRMSMAKSAERTQFQPPLPPAQKPAQPENLALRL